MNPNDTTGLIPKKRNTEGKTYLDKEGNSDNQQEKKTSKQLVIRKIHIRSIHAKLIRGRQKRISWIVHHSMHLH